VSGRHSTQSVEELRDALRFYADVRNHRGVGTGRVYNDRGRVAQRALGKRCEPCYGSGWVEDPLRRRDTLCRECDGKGYVEGEAR
jgi:hypothetical protein